MGLTCDVGFFILSLIYEIEFRIFKTGEQAIPVTALIISYQGISKQFYKMYGFLI